MSSGVDGVGVTLHDSVTLNLLFILSSYHITSCHRLMFYELINPGEPKGAQMVGDVLILDGQEWTGRISVSPNDHDVTMATFKLIN